MNKDLVLVNRKNVKDEIVIYKNKEYTLSDFAHLINVPYKKVYSRYINGWRIDKIANIKNHDCRKKYSVTYKGVEIPINVICEMTKLSDPTIRRRIRDGWDVEDIFRIPKNVLNIKITDKHGKTYRIKEIKKITGVNENTIYIQYISGWNFEDIVKYKNMNTVRIKNKLYTINEISEKFELSKYIIYKKLKECSL